MKRFIWIGLLALLSAQWMQGQHFPKMDTRNYVSDSTVFMPKKPWLAAGEVFGLNVGIWAFDRFLMNEDFAHINGHTIKNNFKTGPVWDTDKFSTNLVAHPYHGSLYFNAARSNGMNFWQSIPFAAGGSLMWEFFMENEPPSINDLMVTTFGGVELGEITYRLSDLFIDDRSSGAERVGREILSGLISPVRGINRLITGEAWRHRPHKGRAYSFVPVNFIVSAGPRFLAEQEHSKHGTTSMHLSLRLDYGDPFEDEFYSPYRISEAAAVGGGLIYYKRSEPSDKVDAYGEFYVNGVALGGGSSDYFRLDERDYNMGSGYSVKAFTGLTYNKHWTFLLNMENYHIFTWKGYNPDIDLSTVDPNTFSVQGDKGHSRLTVMGIKLVYLSSKKWNISLSNRYFSRRTHYSYHDDVNRATYDLMLSLGVKI